MLRDGLLALSLRMCAALLSLVTLAVFGRMLSSLDFGYFGTVIAMLSLLAPICGLGWPLTLLRYFAQGEVSQQLVHISLIQILFVSVGVALAGAFLFEKSVFVLGLAILPAYVSFDLIGAILRARGALFSALVPRDILWRAILLLGVVFAANFPAGEQTTSLLSVGLPAIVLFAVVQFVVLSQSLKPSPMPKNVGVVRNRIWASNVTGTLFANLDTLAIGAFCGIEVAGGYFAASRLSSIIVFVHNAVGLFVGPHLAQHSVGGNFRELRSYLRFAATMAGVPAIGAFLIFASSGRFLLGAISPDAEEMFVVLLLLSMGQVVNGLTGASGLFLAMSGQEGLVARVSIQSLVLGAITIVLGAKLYGPLGAASATLCVQSLSEIRLWLASRGTISETFHRGMAR